MKNTLSFSKYLLIFGLPILLILSLIMLVNSPWYLAQSPHLIQAITLDFVLTLPLFYFFLIRKTEISKLSVVSVFILGIVVASFIIPAEDQTFLDLIKTFVFPVVELGVLGFIGYKFFQLRKEFKNTSSQNLDFYDLINVASKEVFPGRVGALLATEISVVYYAFFNWKNRTIQSNEFTYHKRSGSREVLGAFTFAILIEAFAMHLILEMWSPTAALILTILSLYTALQVFALIRSMSQRPHLIRDGKLYLRYGFMSNTQIELSDIESIEFGRKAPEDEGFKKLAIIGDLDGHNVILKLKKEYELKRIYGLKDKFTMLGLHVDEKEGFQQALS